MLPRDRLNLPGDGLGLARGEKLLTTFGTPIPLCRARVIGIWLYVVWKVPVTFFTA